MTPVGFERIKHPEGGYYYTPPQMPIRVVTPHELDEFNFPPPMVPKGPMFGVIQKPHAGIAQLVEQQFCKLHVPSSNLGASK